MSGIGPPEPGEGTHAWDTRHPRGPRPAGRTRAAAAARYARHRRTTLALATATALLGAGGALYATRPQQPLPHPPRPHPEAPYPSQVVDVTYLESRPTPAGAPPRSFSFTVLLSVASGPPVTVTRVAQPYAGLSLTTRPPAPWRTGAGAAREVTVTMHVTKCGKVPWHAGLPFLDLTLRNARAIQVQSFILGGRYARHLSHAVEVACGNRVR
ncbi:Tat pathway signal sequence domain protein [Streptomyces sp. AGS-58]|uniref:Tat pathway signal sequence domain protein n=1 Tax=unclassified Streptomyces TaxID=2593676 RepID=UPI0035A3298C